MDRSNYIGLCLEAIGREISILREEREYCQRTINEQQEVIRKLTSDNNRLADELCEIKAKFEEKTEVKANERN